MLFRTRGGCFVRFLRLSLSQLNLRNLLMCGQSYYLKLIQITEQYHGDTDKQYNQRCPLSSYQLPLQYSNRKEGSGKNFELIGHLGKLYMFSKI
jgi:hypothetical protein